MTQKPIKGKVMLILVMAWCRQSTRHNLITKSVSPYGEAPPDHFKSAYLLQPTVGILMHSAGTRNRSSSFVNAKIASAMAPLVTVAHSSDNLPWNEKDVFSFIIQIASRSCFNVKTVFPGIVTSFIKIRSMA